jgi:V-type H+-transporting ATPase subunit E
LLLSLLEKSKLEAAKSSEKKDEYKKLLTNLVAQGLAELEESNVVIVARKVDVALVQEVLKDSIALFQKNISPRTLDVKLTVSDREFLPPPPSSDNTSSGQFRFFFFYHYL